jgi:hypothetical protein
LVGTGVFLFGAVSVSGGRLLGPHRGVTRLAADLTVVDTGTVTFSAVVHPHGRATTAFFQFGLASRYREPRPSGLVYDMSTTAVHLAAAFHVYAVSGRASGLVPNAVYNLRLVASSAAGTVYSPNATFRTAKDPPPPLPLIGAMVNVEPIWGLVLIRPPRANLSTTAAAASLVQGQGFRPLTETRQLPVNSQIDARAGGLRLVVASPLHGHTQRVTLAGGVFLLSQTRQRLARGLTTANLLDGDFPGAPTSTSCAASTSARRPVAGTRAARLSSVVLQTLRARDQAGRFRTRGRYSTAMATAGGTVWDTTDRCDGTLTIVRRGTVVVSDLRLGKTMAVHAGERYLAQAV